MILGKLQTIAYSSVPLCVCVCVCVWVCVSMWFVYVCVCVCVCCMGESVGLPWTSDQSIAETSTWQHTTLTTNIHAPGGIRTHNLSRRAAEDLRLRPRSHWDRHFSPNTEVNIICITNYRLSCRQLTKNFRLSLSYFDFTGTADPVVFLVFFLYESRIVRQRVLQL